jgi:hypothetical protein
MPIAIQIAVERGGDALTEAFAHPGPALVELITDPNALAIPPKITASQVRGFTLGIGRTVLAGGVGKMAGLARSNLRNIPGPNHDGQRPLAGLAAFRPRPAEVLFFFRTDRGAAPVPRHVR